MSSLPHAEQHTPLERSDYLYVIVVGVDRIKVGISYAPVKRLAEHRRLAAAFGAVSGRHWVSCPGVGTAENETRLIDWCARHATQRFSREYFAGLTFETAVAYADALNGVGRSRRGWIFDPNPIDALTAFDNVSGMRTQGSVEEAAVWMGLSDGRIRELIDSGDLRVLSGTQIPVISMRRWLMSQAA